jgi:hypothetical protein
MLPRIHYDEHDMLELFESEPNALEPYGCGIYFYKKKIQNGVRLLIYLSVYENLCHISLGVEEHDVFFDSKLKNVEYLRKEGSFLRIHQANSKKDCLLYFPPNFLVKIENNEGEKGDKPTHFDEYDLYELFGAEPIVVLSEAEGQYICTNKDSNGVNVTFSLSAYQRKCTIAVDIDENVVFETELKNVEYLLRRDSCLRIHQTNSENDYLLYLLPYFCMQMENDEDATRNW